MKLNKTDYVLERASDGGYYAWLTVNMQCTAYEELKMKNEESAALCCLKFLHSSFLVLHLFNAQFINNVRSSCIFIDDK